MDVKLAEPSILEVESLSPKTPSSWPLINLTRVWAKSQLEAHPTMLIRHASTTSHHFAHCGHL
jgi:hypothetical protein